MMKEELMEQIDEKWKESFVQLVDTVERHIPEGFEQVSQYGGIGFVVPLTTYAQGYHCTPNTPLPFISIVAQKRHLALYHMGVYADPELLTWFQEEYAKIMPTKLNMGKSCIRFTNPNKIPYSLIGELASKMTPEQWINLYEGERNKLLS
ncbi:MULTISPECIES: DUF1801 domain-containing protein [Paenibacillus]|uniref:DUF1801 domain-containing protein n=1 Tax=Paenibacillus TaxID=44249 RepID=UPI00203AC015|nr:DUF1801 domain-containing protein [Paenibacillus camelliae]